MKDERIKILYTTSNFKTAGSGKVIYDLTKGLDKSKFKVEIACGHSDGDFFKIVESLGQPIHVIKTKTRYWPYWSLYSRISPISRFIKTQNYDIVHSWHWSNDWTEAIAAETSWGKMGFYQKGYGL